MASAGSGDEKAATVTLISSDNEHFEVPEAVATLSQTIRHMIEDGCTDGGVPLPNVTGRILAKVLEYCNKHAAASDKDELEKFDKAFVDIDDQATLFDLVMAANYLDIRGMLDLTCQTIADMIKGKSVEEIRETFNIKNDFTPEEEAEIRRENQWAFDD
ncbi:hypothetical protein PAHAL_2G404800 [Panicum hallii]|jgi:S-phase kinase-associated protein 1|uniref:SKP1-like protein n=1 Tax=Panicum hallii TaxID=206008 RepID=A0A2S3H325_9POAL|nr:SKP1-like protein 1 [Panicum hallii]PAN14372.1 hypothetical protein PAHAL_2G404800 [Panicum hallii]